MLELNDYSIIYNDKKIIKYKDIEIKDKEFIGLSGSSGCGKTSLLDSIFGIDFKGKISYSKAELFNKDISSIRKEKYNYLSYCPQFCQDALNPKITIKNHIQLLLSSNNISCKEEEVHNILEGLSLEKDLLDYYPYMMSGGQKQRAVIMLCLLKKPRLLVLDEPSSALDLITTKIISDFLNNIRNQTAIIMVSHNYDFLQKLCDRVIKL
jgi:ABC-type dipeptide/oligopeptide/nickel transport system ATPase subunit